MREDEEEGRKRGVRGGVREGGERGRGERGEKERDILSSRTKLLIVISGDHVLQQGSIVTEKLFFGSCKRCPTCNVY